MFEIEDLFELDLLQEGLFSSGSEFKEFVSGADDETIYGLVKEGVFESLEDFQSQVNLKKKEEELPGTGDEGDTDADTTTPSVGDGSSDTSLPESNLLNRTVQDVNPEDVPTEEVEEVVVEQEDVIPPVVEQEEEVVVQGADELVLTPEEAQARLDDLLQAGDGVTVSTSITDGKVESEEDETWLEESWLGQAMDWAFDDVPILGVLSADFWGDMYRAIGNGFTKGQSVDEAIELFAKGKNISDSDLQEYIQAVKRSEDVAMSDEMKSFQKIYEDNGGGFLGFILGFGSNLSIAPELLIDSFSSMLNPASVAAAGVGAGTGAATGAALTAVSGPGALFGAGAGAVGGAFGGASLALEFGMSYTEFMKEEVESKGGKFDAEGIRLVLEDPEALQRIRNKAATRGLAIGMIDAITAGVAGKVVGTTGKTIAKGTAKQLAKAGKGAVTKNAVQKGVEVAARYGKRIAPVASGLGVEIGGGSLGEATARALAGQEMDIAEIGLEGFAGAGSAPITLARGAFITPQYRLGKDFVTKDYILATIGTATPKEIAAMDIDITNDPDLKAVVTDIKAESQFALEIEKTYPMIPDGEAKSEIIKLQIERSKLPDTASETTKLRKRQIDQRIAEIVDDYSQVMTEEVRVEQDGNTFSEIITVTKGDAKKELAKNGIEDPTQRQISDMQKALMEREKSRDRSAEKALADAEAEAQAQAEAEALVTDQEVMDRLNETGTVYTDQEFDNVKKLLIKEKKDAIQKSSTEGVDVQESSRDGEGVGEGNIQQEATQEGGQEAQTKKTTKIAEKEKAEVETKKFRDDDVVLKEETFTITDEDGSRREITVRTNLDGSLRKADIQNFDEDGNSIRGEFFKLADNDIVVRDGLTAEQILTDRLVEGEVIEKTSERSGTEINSSKKIAQLTTDQKQKLGIETETQGVDKQSRIDSAPKNFQTIPPSQRKGGPQVFRVPGSRTVDVQLNEDGTVQAVNRKTGRPLKKTPKKIERFILETVIDVNEGKKADLEGVSNPREVDQRIIDTSENPKEVADAISALKKQEQAQLEARDIEFGIEALIAKFKKGAGPVVKFTPESWKRVTGLSPRESGVSSIWIASKERGGVSLEDGYLPYVTDPDQIGVDVEITPSEVAEFVKANPNKEAMNALKLDAESSTLTDLRRKFTELTGMPATDANIDVVNKIDPDRAPNVDVQQQSQERLKKESTEPGIFGKKRGPSAKRITQGNNKKTVEVNDSKALAEQIRLESKAARESETAYRKSQRKVLDLISSLKTRGIIRSKQSLVMTRKVLSTNYSSDVQVKKLVDYVTKVMDDASINQTIKDIQTAIGSPKKKQGVKYNIRRGKFGANSDALVDVLTALSDADISNIPLEKLNATKQLLEFYGKTGKLEFTNIGGDLKTGLDILNSMDKSMEQNIDLEAEGKKKKKKKTKEYDVTKAISEIKTKKPDLSKLTDDNDIEIAKQFRNLTREDIKSLIKEKDGEFDYSNLETLRVVMQNLTQGVVNVDTNNVLNEIISNRASKPVSSVVKKVTKNGILKHFKNVSSSIKLALTDSRSGKNLILDKIRSNVATAVDNAFGNLNSTVIYDNTFGKLAKASENMNVFISKIRAEVDTARNLLETDGVNKVRKFLGGRNTDNKVVKKAYKLRLLQLTREYLNNFVDGEPNPKAPNPKDFLDLTIKDIRNKKGTQQLSELDAKALESLQKEFTVDDEISLEKLEKSLSKNEKKALKILDAQNAKLAPLSKFTSGVLRGNRVELYNSYSHRVVLRSGVDQNADLTQRGKEYAQASTKGGANLSRTKGAKPISFDPFYSLERGSTEVALDYFMTNEVRRVKKTINKVTAEINADPNSTDAQKSAVSALDKSVTEILEVTFGEQLRDVSFLGNLANKVKRIAYQAILGSVPRMGSEIIANMSMIVADPKAAARGFSEFSKLSFLSRKEGTDILNNLGSRMTTRLFDTKSLSSRFADMTGFFQSTPSEGTARGRVANIMGIIMRMGVKQTAAVVDKIAGTIISFPDKSLSIPMWYGKFATTFEAETGIKLTSKDLKEIGKGESKYLGDKYKAAIAEATRKADQTATMVGTSKNSFDTVIKNQYRQTGKGGGGMLNAYRAANKFMANFSLFEYATARFAVGALQRRGDISRTQALGILAGVGMRMTMYPILYAALSEAFDDELFGTDTEEDESDIEDIITRQVVGTMLTLMTRKSMGNIPNLVPSMLIEQFNEQALKGLRNGEDYNPYKHSIVYNQLSLDNLEDKGLTRTAVGIMAGPYGPIIKTLERMSDLSFRSINNKTEESKEKNKKELTDRMVLELLGNSGLVPFYKDIRRIIIKDMFEGQRKSEQRRREDKKYKEYLEFLKESDPGAYREELRNKANDSFEGEYFEDNNFDPSEWE